MELRVLEVRRNHCRRLCTAGLATVRPPSVVEMAAHARIKVQFQGSFQVAFEEDETSQEFELRRRGEGEEADLTWIMPIVVGDKTPETRQGWEAERQNKYSSFFNHG
jgi:hypothetical protein